MPCTSILRRNDAKELISNCQIYRFLMSIALRFTVILFGDAAANENPKSKSIQSIRIAVILETWSNFFSFFFFLWLVGSHTTVDMSRLFYLAALPNIYQNFVPHFIEIHGQWPKFVTHNEPLNAYGARVVPQFVGAILFCFALNCFLLLLLIVFEMKLFHEL